MLNNVAYIRDDLKKYGDKNLKREHGLVLLANREENGYTVKKICEVTGGVARFFMRERKKRGLCRMINIQVPDNEFKVDLRTEDYGRLLDKSQGIYMIYNNDDVLMYAGKSKDIRNRVKMHMNSADSNPLKGHNHNFHYVVGFYEKSYFDLSLYEIYLINTLKPKLNYDNVYTYETERYIDKWKSSTAIRAEREEELALQRRMDNYMQDFKI